MKTALTILLVLVLAAEAVIFWQVRRLIHSWGREVEEDKALTDGERRYVEVRLKLMSVLSAAAIVLFLLRFVFFDLFPLIRG